MSKQVRPILSRTVAQIEMLTRRAERNIADLLSRRRRAHDTSDSSSSSNDSWETEQTIARILRGEENPLLLDTSLSSNDTWASSSIEDPELDRILNMTPPPEIQYMQAVRRIEEEDTSNFSFGLVPDWLMDSDLEPDVVETSPVQFPNLRLYPPSFYKGLEDEIQRQKLVDALDEVDEKVDDLVEAAEQSVNRSQAPPQRDQLVDVLDEVDAHVDDLVDAAEQSARPAASSPSPRRTVTRPAAWTPSPVRTAPRTPSPSRTPPPRRGRDRREEEEKRREEKQKTREEKERRRQEKERRKRAKEEAREYGAPYPTYPGYPEVSPPSPEVLPSSRWWVQGQSPHYTLKHRIYLRQKYGKKIAKKPRGRSIEEGIYEAPPIQEDPYRRYFQTQPRRAVAQPESSPSSPDPSSPETSPVIARTVVAETSVSRTTITPAPSQESVAVSEPTPEPSYTDMPNTVTDPSSPQAAAYDTPVETSDAVYSPEYEEYIPRDLPQVEPGPGIIKPPFWYLNKQLKNENAKRLSRQTLRFSQDVLEERDPPTAMSAEKIKEFKLAERIAKYGSPYPPPKTASTWRHRVARPEDDLFHPAHWSFCYGEINKPRPPKPPPPPVYGPQLPTKWGTTRPPPKTSAGRFTSALPAPQKPATPTGSSVRSRSARTPTAQRRPRSVAPDQVTPVARPRSAGATSGTTRQLTPAVPQRTAARVVTPQPPPGPQTGAIPRANRPPLPPLVAREPSEDPRARRPRRAEDTTPQRTSARVKSEKRTLDPWRSEMRVKSPQIQMLQTNIEDVDERIRSLEADLIGPISEEGLQFPVSFEDVATISPEVKEKIVNSFSKMKRGVARLQDLVERKANENS